MILRPNLDDVTAADLQAIVDEGLRERRTIDYKLTLPGRQDGQKHSFLADICSFANAAGGELIYGIEEDNGKPIRIHGLPDLKADDDKLRLDSIIRTGISPRVPGIQFHVVDNCPGGSVLVIRIPRSWAGPHMVSFNDSSRFYSRSNSAGNFQMDHQQIREAFEGAAGIFERAREWREHRLQQIESGDTPVPCITEPRLVLHLMPLESFVRDGSYSAVELKKQNRHFQNPGVPGNSFITFDGLLTYPGTPENKIPYRTYCQVWRTGCVESVTSAFQRREKDDLLIWPMHCEELVINAAASHFAGLRALGVSPPVLVSVSLLGAQDGRIGDLDPIASTIYPQAIDRDVLTLPTIAFEQFDADIPRQMRPAFDALWNAFGAPGSPQFDGEGNWRSRG